MTTKSRPRPDGNAIVYCDGAFATTYGKTAHGLVRGTDRYRVLSVIDSKQAGRDAGAVLGRSSCCEASARPEASDSDGAQ